MNKKTLKALKGSIAHWEENAQLPFRNGSTRWQDCPLCLLFNTDGGKYDEGFSCEGCPVMAKTGEKFCDETPYEEAFLAKISGNETRWQAAALAELDFLKSLLPPTAKAVGAPVEAST